MTSLPALILAALLYLEVARQDLLYRRIPNLLSSLIVLLACLRWCIARDWAHLEWGAIAGAVAFLVTAACYSRGWLGGGDVKLIAATGVLTGLPAFFSFLIVMALAGGILSILVLLWRACAPHGSESAKTTVPYGIAISVSAMLILVFQYEGRVG